MVKTSKFGNNNVMNWGGTFYCISSTITIELSEFDSNNASLGGALSFPRDSSVVIKSSTFDKNTATSWGGALHTGLRCNITIDASKFDRNAAADGGVLYSTENNIITISDSSFTNNNSITGAVIYNAIGSTMNNYGLLLVANNSAERNAVLYLSGTKFSGDDSGHVHVIFSNNKGSLVAFNSNVTFMGSAIFSNSHPPQTTTSNFQEGGVMTLIQSYIFLGGTSTFEYNHAENGGAILSSESKLNVNGASCYYSSQYSNWKRRRCQFLKLIANYRAPSHLLITLQCIKGEDFMPSAHLSRLFLHCISFSIQEQY